MSDTLDRLHSAVGNEAAPRVPAPSGSDRRRAEIRDIVLSSYLNFLVSKELSEWLGDLGLPFTGSIEEKVARIRHNRHRITLPAESLHRQTLFYLTEYSHETLQELCLELGLAPDGDHDMLFKRLYCEVGKREGWLQPLSIEARAFLHDMLPVIKPFDLALWEDVSDTLANEVFSISGPPAYGRVFIIVLLPYLLREAHGAMLEDELRTRANNLV